MIAAVSQPRLHNLLGYHVCMPFMAHCFNRFLPVHF